MILNFYGAFQTLFRYLGPSIFALDMNHIDTSRMHHLWALEFHLHRIQSIWTIWNKGDQAKGCQEFAVDASTGSAITWHAADSRAECDNFP